MAGMARRQARRRAVATTAVTASAVSSARRNRAQRKVLEDVHEQQAPAAQPQQTAAALTGTEQELQEAKRLFDQGLITEAEYEAKRKQILGL